MQVADVRARRVDALDGLRALAVSLVVLDHVTRHFAGGGVGVNVFFVLSGYLITGILLGEIRNSGSISLGLFYARRGLRLYPALLAMLIVTLVLGASIHAAVVAATYTTNLFNTAGYGIGVYGHTWSLAAEEQFYLLWPLLLPLAARRPRAALWALAAGATASVTACTLGTIHMVNAHGTITPAVFNPLWQAHGLLIGCMLAIATRAVSQVKHAGTLAAAGLAGVLAVAVTASVTVGHHWAAEWNLLAEFAAAALILGLSEPNQIRGIARVFTSSGVVWIGRRSYAIYLWHLPLILLFALHGFGGYEGAVVAVAVSVIAAGLSARWIEAPFLRLKDRMHPTPPVFVPEPIALGIETA